ncbi:MAG TPA: hypothetical protein VLM84_14660 [Chromatiaceae bacterium]|nr:hypothetical protein [Chromatiaceae bacterium]
MSCGRLARRPDGQVQGLLGQVPVAEAERGLQHRKPGVPMSIEAQQGGQHLPVALQFQPEGFGSVTQGRKQAAMPVAQVAIGG